MRKGPPRAADIENLPGVREPSDEVDFVLLVFGELLKIRDPGYWRVIAVRVVVLQVRGLIPQKHEAALAAVVIKSLFRRLAIPVRRSEEIRRLSPASRARLGVGTWSGQGPVHTGDGQYIGAGAIGSDG